MHLFFPLVAFLRSFVLNLRCLLIQKGLYLYVSSCRSSFLNRSLVFWESRRCLIWMSVAVRTRATERPLAYTGCVMLHSSCLEWSHQPVTKVKMTDRKLHNQTATVIIVKLYPSTVWMPRRTKHCYYIYFNGLCINKWFGIDYSDCSFSFFSLQLRNEVLPLQLSAVQRLENFSLLEDKSRAQKLSTETLSRQSVKQKLLVSRLHGREIDACFCAATLCQSAVTPAFASGVRVPLSLPLDFEFLKHECFFVFYSPSSCWFKSVMSHVSCGLCSLRI